MKKESAITVIEILQKLSGVTKISEKDSLQTDVGLDSLGMVSLLMELEESCEIELKESDLNPFDLVYVSDVINLVDHYMENRNEKSS